MLTASFLLFVMNGCIDVDAEGDSGTRDLLLSIATGWEQSIQLHMFYGGRMQLAYYFERCSEADALLFFSECLFHFYPN